MKKLPLLLTFAAALSLGACTSKQEKAPAEDTRVSTREKILVPDAKENGMPYFIIPEESELTWSGKKLTREHTGTIQLKEGSLAVLHDQVIGGTIVIDMTTIANTDLTDTEDNQKLVQHLKSDDFFGVEKYPLGTFTFDKTEPIAGAAPGEPNVMINGTLTLKDKTDQIRFPAWVEVNNEIVRAKATVTVDRSKFNVRYGSPTFFENLGDKAIANEFVIKFMVVAEKKTDRAS